MNHVTTIAPAPAPPTLLKDAGARMALWANVLPGWCDQDEPAAKILQTALGVWLVPEAIDKEDEQVLMTLRLVDDKYFDDIENTKRRFQYRPRLVVTQEDIEAAGLVIHQANRVLLLEIARKKRWRATIGGDVFLSDWTIIKRHLVQHLSFREIARDLGLDEAGIRRRFHDALASISAAFGPIQWPQSLSPHPNPYYRGARRIGRRPVWHHKIHIREDRPDFQTREQVLAEELAKVDQFIAAGGTVQKLPPGLAVDFDTADVKGHPIGHVKGKTCAAYGADGKLLWVVSYRPQAAWDNEPGGSRYPDGDLFADARWEGKQHSSFERKWRRGLQWLNTWQSKQAQRFAIKFYNCGEDGLLPGRKNGADIRGRPNRDCTGPDWEYQGIYVAMREPPRQREVYAPGWDEGPIPKRSSSSGVEPGEVRNDTRDLMARWVSPSSYLNLTPEEINSLFLNEYAGSDLKDTHTMRQSPTRFELRVTDCLAKHGSLSFTGLLMPTDAANDQLLARTLNRMRRRGRVIRHVHPTTPPTTSYTLPASDGSANEMK